MRPTEVGGASGRSDDVRYSDTVSVDLGSNTELRDAVERARAAAEANGSLHPEPGKRIETTAAYRAAMKRLMSDGTYTDAVAAVVAANPELA